MRYKIIASMALSILVSGCVSIWNAGDLEKWVRKEAVKSGCDQESIALDDWYKSVNGENVWHGTCKNKKTGEQMQFKVGVDKVWTPSSP